MTLENFLLEYGGVLLGSFAVGFATGFSWLYLKKALELIT